MLHLTSIKITNFGLIKDASASIAPNDFTLVAGEHLSGEMGTLSIGSGKTTFLTAIWWGLTNELIYRSRDYLYSDLIGPFGKYTEVQLVIESAERTYVLTRRRDKSSYSVNLLENGTDITSKDNTGTELLIQEKLGVNWEVFRYSNYIPQEDSRTGFLYAPEKTRRQLITQLYHQQFFDNMYLLFKEERQTLERQVLEKERDTSQIEGQIQQAELQAQQLQLELDEIKLNNLRVAAVLTDANKPDRIMARMEALRLAMKRRESAKVKVETMARSASERAAEASVGLATLEVEAESLQATQDAILGRLGDMKSQLRTRGFCPLCRTQLSDAAMIALKKACNKEIKNYRAADLRRSFIQSAKDDLNSKMEMAKTERKTLADKLSRITENYNHDIRKLSNLEVDLKRAYEQQRQHIDPGPIERALDAASTRVRQLHKQIIEHEWAIDVLKKKLGRYSIWEDGYNTTIRSMAFESVIDRFTELVGEKLAQMYGDNIAIKFDTKKTKADSVQDKFTIQIKDRDMGSWKGIVFASGGQKRIISLAIAMSMMELSRPQLALYLIDEGLEGVDPTVARNALGAIRSMSKSLSVLFVTHQTDTPAGERRITALRKDGCIDIV